MISVSENLTFNKAKIDAWINNAAKLRPIGGFTFLMAAGKVGFQIRNAKWASL